MILRITSFFGLIVLFGIAWILSENRRKISWRPVISGIVLQLVIAVVILKTGPGEYIFEAAKNIFVSIIEASQAGQQFIWSGVQTSAPFVFVISVPCTIIFFSSLMALLYHWGIMQKVIKSMAWVMRRTMGISGRESLAAAANVFVGMTEAPLVIRPCLKSLSRSEMMALMTTGLATIAGTVLAAYAGMGINPGHLLTASFMSAPAALAIAKLIVPEQEGVIDENISMPEYIGEKRAVNSFDAVSSGSRDGLYLALNVLAMLVAVVSLLALINIVLRVTGGWINIDNLSLQKIFSFVGWPFALIMGVDPSDARAVGELLSTKVFMTEFVAYKSLSDQLQSLSPRSVTIATYALCGFANFASVAIIIGGLSTLVPERKTLVVQLVMKALVGGLLASLSTAAIVGMFI